MMDTSVYIVLIVLLNSVVAFIGNMDILAYIALSNSVIALIRNSLNNSAIQEILRKINNP